MLDDGIQRWIWEQKWTELREIQEKSIRPILSGVTDVIISSQTASGKTEAAFLPILSRVIQSPHTDGFDAIYIGPLKALINDQFDRLDLLCEHLNVKVFRWHGDVSQSKKKQAFKDPDGVLLITPESLESLFVNHGSSIPSLFSGLKYIVIDELHSFIGNERGRQLQSLLHRLDLLLKRRTPRIALSATLGDLQIASTYLRPDNKMPCLLIQSSKNQQEIKLQVRGYLLRPITSLDENMTISGSLNVQVNDDRDYIDIAADLYRALRGTPNLIFANRRADVETYADVLRRLCEESNVPIEFFPHHGSLAKNLREQAESIIKEKTRPATIVCTTTLEMGIDIGLVNSTAQIGPPPSVASLRQRLGRSGRRGQPSIMRIYIQEDELDLDASIKDRLRSDLYQTVAMVELLSKGWIEPPRISKLHLSTLVQQVLSLIAQYGGLRAHDAWDILCYSGPFNTIDKSTFAELLRCMAASDIIIQDSEDILLLGIKGERIVNHYSFYTAFVTPEEYKLSTQEGKIIGSLPIEYPLVSGSFLIFAGKRWEIVKVETDKKIVIIKPSRGGKTPRFGGSISGLHDRIRQEMFLLYTSVVIPAYLDSRGKQLFSEGSKLFRQMKLETNGIIEYFDDVLIFPWQGDRLMNTLMVCLIADGLNVTNEGIALKISDTNKKTVIDHLKAIASKETISAQDLASMIPNKAEQKYDIYLNENLLNRNYASSNLQTSDIPNIIRSLVKK